MNRLMTKNGANYKKKNGANYKSAFANGVLILSGQPCLTKELKVQCKLLSSRSSK